MTSRREPSAPPTIPGYEPVRLLGMGGFADVFLYQQLMPRRAVAVKVLLASHLGDDVRERFRAEADLMATLSHHPSIVTIYHADVASDGRPFLVMELCSRPGLGQRYRSERMGVAEVLRIGIRLASAVETAHRAGILHRDIKPANVLITDFGWPALTDFGIAATTGWSQGSAVGMSIPWSPPELLAEHPTGDVRADVYSLAATIYSLLARRSPFEVPDGTNTAADLIARIERGVLQPTGRGDVPESLHAVLTRGMDRTPERRHHSALAFARALQQVEAELMLPLTPLDLPEEPSLPSEDTHEREDPADSQATRLRPVQSVSPDAPSAVTGPPPPAHVGIPGPAPQFPQPTAPVPAGAQQAAASATGVPESWQAPTAPEPAPELDRPRRGAGRVVAGVLGGLVVAGALVAGGVLAFRPDADVEPTPVPTTTVPAIRAVPAPEELEGELRDGAAVFTWENPEPEEGDSYLWGLSLAGTEPELELVDEETVTVTPVVPGEQLCIEVSIVRTDGRFSTNPAVACVQG
ncbi:serine/threonine protein kinase [Actinotalea ferrariae]|uniref:serine/threonine-protein kinase n=1 Tax=Actinotalea ferrariae TaxID=1386098 RepID=UPI001C8B384D|nr:serine/threonine-protein kinase [Actinotalea ferrariae]MBX9244356.1 serine/threonine protein kinase [Actinotalea ferrariae]